MKSGSANRIPNKETNTFLFNAGLPPAGQSGNYYAFEPSLHVNAADTIPKPVETKPTPEQIRAWRNRNAERMFHNGPRYMRELESTSLENSGIFEVHLVLPVWKIQKSDNNWLAITLFVALVIFTIINYSFRTYTGNLFRSIANYPTSARLFRERNASITQAGIWFEWFSFIVLGVFLYQASVFYSLNIEFNGFVLYLFSFSVVTLFFLAKIGLYKFVGFVFENPEETNEFIFNVKNSLRIMGLAVLPIVALIEWSPYFLPDYLFLAGLIMLSLIYILLMWRGGRIFLKKDFSVFYLFLYLCTLEIIPLLIAVKLLAM